MNHDDTLSNIAACASYMVSAGLMIGDAMHWLNDNAGALGVILGTGTFLMNLHFNIKRSRSK